VLAFAQPSEQHRLPVGELQRIVMDVRVAHIDPPEPSHFLPEFHIREKSKKALALDDFLFERDLCAGQKAHRHVRLSDCSESSRHGVLELRCYQRVPDLGGSGCDEV
jgi:hypothetical protein